MKLERHYLSGICCNMPEEDFGVLKANIQVNGIQSPEILLLDGKILDGWHRYRAAQELDIVDQLQFKEVDVEDPASIVIANNISRRHLPKGISAIIVCEAYGWTNGYEERRKAQLDNVSLTLSVKTDKELGQLANCSRAMIIEAKKIILAGRSNAVKAGDVTKTQVLQEIAYEEKMKKLADKKKELETSEDFAENAAENAKGSLTLAENLAKVVSEKHPEAQDLMRLAEELKETELAKATEAEEAANKLKKAKSEVELEIGVVSNGKENNTIMQVVTLDRNTIDEASSNLAINIHQTCAETTYLDISQVMETMVMQLHQRKTRKFADLTNEQKVLYNRYTNEYLDTFMKPIVESVKSKLIE